MINTNASTRHRSLALLPFSGETADDKLTATLVKVVINGVSATDGFSTPKASDRYVATQFQRAGSGADAYSDDPYLNVQMLAAAQWAVK